jgi:hypothetical protein
MCVRLHERIGDHRHVGSVHGVELMPRSRIRRRQEGEALRQSES